MIQPHCLNIVIPMAGRGARFVKAGYHLPKPLIPVHGRPMIEVVVENLRPTSPHRYIFICQREHLNSYGLSSLLKRLDEQGEIIAIDSVTEGAACTVLLVEHLINNPQPLMIANCDQYVDINMDSYLRGMQRGAYDGFIMTMTANDPKWSFLRHDPSGEVEEVVEKQVISSEATVGIYNYKHGADFVAAAKSMIEANDRVNGEFYVAPVYNYLIKKGSRIGFMNVGSEGSGMYGLGIPEDLAAFNNLPIGSRLRKAPDLDSKVR